jgi:hypothetical protein
MREILNKASFALVVLMGSALCGCPAPNSYATPRTVDPGHVAHSVALEGLGYQNTLQGDDPSTPDERETEFRTGGFIPTFPSYQVRIGVADRFDIGVHLHNLSSLGADFKYNPVKGVFDLALDPGFQWFTFGSGSTGANGEDDTVHIFYFHVPLMMAVNPTDWFTVVLTPGFTYGLFVGEIFGDNADTTIGGALFRGSLGFQFRVSDKFAIHPEMTILKSFETAGTIISAGIGFNFGSIPGYKDLRDPAGQPDPPQPGAAPQPGGQQPGYPPPGYPPPGYPPPGYPPPGGAPPPAGDPNAVPPT